MFRLMTDEAIVIHSILFFKFDFSRESRDNRSRLSGSRDGNDLSRIELIMI